MNIKEYLEKLNSKCQEIFSWSVSEHQESLAKVHHLTCQLADFSKHINDIDEKNMLRVSCSQLESSSLALIFGMYRQAMGSLRLAFEIGLGCVYLSTNKIEQREWLQGRADIKWAVLSDESNGLFSCRFADAFFPELREHSHEYGVKARTLYRSLSEFVHGNSETWSESGISLEKNEVLLQRYFNALQQVAEIFAFVLCCRYLKAMQAAEMDDVSSLTDHLMHLSPVRELVGGPKDIK